MQWWASVIGLKAESGARWLNNTKVFGASVIPPQIEREVTMRALLIPIVVLFPALLAADNHPRGVRADAGGLTVSSIYKWYQEDFGGNWQGVLVHLRRYANSATAQMLPPFSTIHSDTYDWQLNDAATDSKTMREPGRG
jgi:hypothetical protein